MKPISHRRCLSILTTLLSIFFSYANRHTINYGVAEGLSDGCVKSITQDSHGYIWIATDYGLNRYEGDRFRHFEKGNSGLPANELNFIAPDSSDPDILWIATQRMGLCRYDYSSGTIVAAPAQLDSLTAVTHILPSDDGGMWFVDYHRGVFYFNGLDGRFKEYNHNTIKNLSHSRYWCMAVDSQGKLYIGQNESGLSVVDTLNLTARHIPPATDNDTTRTGRNVYAICIDHNKNVWIGTEMGAYLVNPATSEMESVGHTSTPTPTLSSEYGRVKDIREINNEEIWFATSEGGVNILDLKSLPFTGMKNCTFRHLPVDSPREGSSSHYTQSIFQDTFGNVWIGNYRAGVDVIDHLPFIFERIDYIKDTTYARHSAVWSCAYNPGAGLWLGGNGEIANYIDNSLIKTIKLPTQNGKSHGLVFAMTFDDQGTLWIGTTSQEIWTFSPHSNQFRKIATIKGQVNSFAQHDGKMWIGTENGILSCQLSSGVLSIEEKYNSQLSDRVVRNIKFDRSGKLWAGTFGQGLDVFDTSGKLICNHSKSNGFFSNDVTSMFLDSKGCIWAATRSGVAFFPDTSDPTRWEKIQGIDDGHVKDIREDSKGLFWISTNHGLDVYDPVSHYVRKYQSSPGLPLNSFFDAASANFNDSLLCFGSSNGAFIANPGVLHIPTEKHDIKITSFIVRGDRARNIPDQDIISSLKDEKINLSHSQNNFEISFFVGDHALQKRADFAYRLVGYDDRWIETSGTNHAIFLNMPAGKYVFEVKTRLKGEDWCTPKKILTINVAPPLWLSWWAISIYVVVFILSITGIVRFLNHRNKLQTLLESEKQRNKDFSQLNEERLRFYTNITHELRTPLSLIVGPIEDLAGDKEMPAKYVKKLNLIRESSQQLLNLINDILEFRKTETHNRRLSVEKGKINNFIREIGLRYRELNRKADVKVKLEIATELPEVYYDRDIIESVVNNLMTNAVKYTDSGIITLSCQLVSSAGRELPDSKDSDKEGLKYIEIKVTDTGYGIPADKLPFIFERYFQANGSHQVSGTGIGLALTKSLVELHQGEINVNSEVGKGSEFSILLQVGNIYPEAIHKESSVHSDTGTPANTPENHEEKRFRILVVEDNIQLLEYISQILGNEYDVVTATNGLEGLEKVNENAPDLIVSDIMMPKMDGIQLCAAIKGNFDTSHILLILLTAKDSLSDRQRGYEAGADSFIPKPFSGQLLLSRIHNMIKARKHLSDQILNRPLLDMAESNEQLPQSKDKNSAPNDKDTRTNELTNTLSPIDRQFLEKLTNVIKENIDNPDLSVIFLAEHLFMSQPTLYRKTSAILGISTQEYVRHLRIERAKKLLIEGLMTVSQIAFATGFKSQVAFGNAFKKETDMTPKEFMAAHTKP